jgi:threonine/homoserine/homoserine lactone efflux protein
MGEAIGQVLSLGVAVSLSPVPVIGVVLMLGTPRGSVNGPAFLVAWMAGLAIAGTIVLLIASGADATEGSEPATWASILQLVLGLLLLALAVKQWRGRPRGDAAPTLPGWMTAVDHFTAGRSAAMGIGLSALNPKNLILAAGAATAIAETGASTGDQAVALAVFVVVGSLGPGLPVVLWFALGERAKGLLDGLHTWLARESTTIMAVLCLLIGSKLIGDAITGLAG